MMGSRRHEVLVGLFCFRDEIVILVVLQNFNGFLLDSWSCVFGEMLGNLLSCRRASHFVMNSDLSKTTRANPFVSSDNAVLVFPEIFKC